MPEDEPTYGERREEIRPRIEEQLRPQDAELGTGAPVIFDSRVPNEHSNHPYAAGQDQQPDASSASVALRLAAFLANAKLLYQSIIGSQALVRLLVVTL